MTLAPLFAAAPVIQIHAFAAMAAFALGLVQFAAPKGTIPHRTIGWIWVMPDDGDRASARSGFTTSGWSVRSARSISSSILTLVMLPLAVMHARRHRVDRHRKAMIGIFLGALMIAGLFTLLPGRIMHAVAFGP